MSRQPVENHRPHDGIGQDRRLGFPKAHPLGGRQRHSCEARRVAPASAGVPPQGSAAGSAAALSSSDFGLRRSTRLTSAWIIGLASSLNAVCNSPTTYPRTFFATSSATGVTSTTAASGIHPEPEHLVRFRSTRCASPRVVVGVGHRPEERPFLRCGVVHGDARECLDDGALVGLAQPRSACRGRVFDPLARHRDSSPVAPLGGARVPLARGPTPRLQSQTSASTGLKCKATAWTTSSLERCRIVRRRVAGRAAPSAGPPEHLGPAFLPPAARRRLGVRSIRVPDGLALCVHHCLERQEQAIELAHRGEAWRPRRGSRRRLPAAFELDGDGLREAACLGRITALNRLLERLAQFRVRPGVRVTDRAEHGFEGVTSVCRELLERRGRK